MSPKELWRSTCALFWEHPILWVPVLIADFLNFLLRILQRNLGHRIVMWLWSHHQSMLGGIPDPIPFGSLEGKVALLVGPINLISMFAQIYLYAAALVVTGEFIADLQVGQLPSLRNASQVLTEKLGRVALLSIKVIAWLFTTMFVGVWSFVHLDAAHRNLGSVITVVLLALVGCVMAPSALRVLRIDISSAGVRDANRKSRLLATICVAASGAIGYFCGVAENSIRGLGSPSHTVVRTITEICASWITAFPYVVLFIALSLLARADAAPQLQTGAPEPIPGT